MPDLAYDNFAFTAREQLALRPATLAFVELPESRVKDSCIALRSKLRRHDEVAAFDATHICVLVVDVAPEIARERLVELVTRLGPGNPPRFHVGIVFSPEAGSRDFDSMLKDASEASAAARDLCVLAAVAGEPPSAVAAVPARRGTILVADDDPEVVRLIDAQLRAAGYTTILAPDGQQALAAIEEHAPDLIIVDIMMPRVTGLDVLTALRQRSARPRIVVLSARGREQDITRAFALGADDYVTKPFSPQELIARLERLLRQGLLHS